MSTKPIDFSSIGGKPLIQPQGGGIDFSSIGGQRITDSGTVPNDVGNQVIVPRPGEDFTDTMKRAAEYGKTVTPEMIHKEMQSAPKKVAETLAAAPAIGFTGAAALGGAAAGAEALAPAQGSLFSRGALATLKALGEEHPIIKSVIIKGLEGAGLATGGAAVVHALKEIGWL